VFLSGHHFNNYVDARVVLRLSQLPALLRYLGHKTPRRKFGPDSESPPMRTNGALVGGASETEGAAVADVSEANVGVPIASTAATRHMPGTSIGPLNSARLGRRGARVARFPRHRIQ
jgi:hypothetical protein